MGNYPLPPLSAYLHCCNLWTDPDIDKKSFEPDVWLNFLYVYVSHRKHHVTSELFITSQRESFAEYPAWRKKTESCNRLVISVITTSFQIQKSAGHKDSIILLCATLGDILPTIKVNMTAEPPFCYWKKDRNVAPHKTKWGYKAGRM